MKSRYQKYCNKKLQIVKKYLKKTDQILDAGCGNAEHRHCFLSLSKEFNITGVDLDNGWEKKIIQGDITNLNFSNKSFDIVLSMDVLEHIKDWEKAFNEITRIAKKRVIIVVPTTENKIFFEIMQFLKKIIGIHGIFRGHYIDFFPEQIIKLSKNAGFSYKLIKIEPATPYFYKFLKKYNLRYGGIFILNRRSKFRSED